MRFSDITGNPELKKQIVNQALNHHLPHAIMLLGKPGGGALPMALATAQFIFCENKQGHDSCGQCSACLKVSNLQHPDLHFSFPVYKTDPNSTAPPISDDFFRLFKEYVLAHPYGNDQEWLESVGSEKKGNITAAECRQIIRKLQLRTFESEYKILILWYPEYLGEEGNILLKLIEEPTDKTILIMVAENLDHVLQTIQSRTQLYPLRSIEDKEILDTLLQKGIGETQATQVSRLAEGNMHYAYALLEEEDHNLIDTLRDWLNFMYSNKGVELNDWSLEIADKTKNIQKNFIEYVINLLEHLLRSRQIGPDKLNLLDSEVRIIENLKLRNLSDFRIHEITQLLNESIHQINRNANSKILFHSLSLRIQQILLQKKQAAHAQMS
ncbi:MAG: hypothetical protein JNJ58_03405 [Chitinophagaceae bacterium]|nr:hypothetical protein [Chitinophagaceae bacterium]